MDEEPDLAAIITPELMLIVMASVIGFGVLISVTCAYLSINKFLKMKVERLHHI